MTGKVA